ncbi:MAG TPA: Arc family DNA-binding protein, partial [Burkholderiales bacterium]|nr:Arc family DNA-binding protein [Burkholderiales bacterium]
MAKRKLSDTVDIKLRMKEALRARVERAAGKRGVSMNAEMVSRLEQSFDDEDRIAHFRPLIYGRQLAAVLEVLGRVMRDTGQHVRLAYAPTPSIVGADGWMDDPRAFDQAFKGAVQILEALRPPGDPTLPEAEGTA